MNTCSTIFFGFLIIIVDTLHRFGFERSVILKLLVFIYVTLIILFSGLVCYFYESLFTLTFKLNLLLNILCSTFMLLFLPVLLIIFECLVLGFFSLPKLISFYFNPELHPPEFDPWFYQEFNLFDYVNTLLFPEPSGPHRILMQEFSSSLATRFNNPNPRSNLKFKPFESYSGKI